MQVLPSGMRSPMESSRKWLILISISMTVGGLGATGLITNPAAAAAPIPGRVVAWGEDGDGQTAPPPALSSAIAVAAGAYHSLALRSDGTVMGWGNNDFRQATAPL